MCKFKINNYFYDNNLIKVRKMVLMFVLLCGYICVNGSLIVWGCFFIFFVFGICCVYVWGRKFIDINCLVIFVFKFILYMYISLKIVLLLGWVIYFIKIKLVFWGFLDILKV